MTEPIRIVALAAGLSTPSSTRMLADQLSRAARLELERAGAVVDVQTVELRELAHDITDAMLTRFTGERLGVVVESIRTADAVIAVTPVFNVGPSGLFKSFFDAMDIEIWKDKPVLLGATAGTPRHSLAIDYALRPMFGYLKAQVVPTSVFAASADFGAGAEGQQDQAPLASRVRRAAGELAAMLTAQPPQPDADTFDGADGARAVADADGAKGDAHGDGSRLDLSAASSDGTFRDFVPMGALLGRD
ncbi:NAD(P)H-dependent oxidoreductase [Brachybacterium sp. p3-SID1565]|uniref:CE1759 family FMN reductase n=1 Tax=Brachybacterium sp. p3-SID1565 TaxID=2916046 RepID=UPI0021A293BD|nr:CE1759 family FMN reductase [Brachybacterium sp. p3-SID1565]MCT1386114.1 NAD(P)H-dependent oxidoreductase [Brachybacterium sp. p3-SID1565]